jgi:SM-20-related protein
MIFTMQEQFALISDGLAQKGFCVCPHFLPQNFLDLIRDDFDSFHNQNLFMRAGVGRGGGHQIQDSVRRDEIFWLGQDFATPTQQSIEACFNELRSSLNQNLFLSLKDFECHYALYPAGGFYQKHRDSFAHQNSRLVSVVLYLNKNWQPTDGGQLRIYTPTSFIDVEPKYGTLVCFLSREIEHEVLSSKSNRFSLAGWFLDSI